MAKKTEQEAILEAEGGVRLTMAPEGSAERVTENEPLPVCGSYAPADAAVLAIGGSPRHCVECGYPRWHHEGEDSEGAIPSLKVTTYDAAGEAIDVEVPVPPREPELPGMPSGGVWGDYQGRRVTHVKLGFGGGPDAPAVLAGRLGLGARLSLLITGTIASNGYKRDKESGMPYGTASLFIESVSDAMGGHVQPVVLEYFHSVLRRYAERARELLAREDEGASEDAWAFMEEIAGDDDAPADDQAIVDAEPSMLSRVLAEATGEAI